jgi:cellulose synthase/poly-beta-1,6-N-acetylglucosamine synthase-like glycosyltransferase
MHLLNFIFWILFSIVFYAYLGYGLLLLFLVTLKKVFGRKPETAHQEVYEPEVTLFITAYNEKDYVEAKMMNSEQLDYPSGKLHIVWVTDGSDDGTVEELQKYEGISVYHTHERKGKIGAMNRGMKLVNTPVTVFSDANSMLGKDSIRRMVELFRDPLVGCVSGEKRISGKSKDSAAGAGEGLYWKYESALKKWDAELYSAVGAAGELFAIRTALYEEVESDTLLDDFIISLRIAQRGYTIQYDPDAYAIETASANVSEELKRKVRIAAGGIQSVIRLSSLLNIFRYGTLSFQYISHRVLRWTLAPLALFLMFPAGFLLALQNGLFTLHFYPVLFALQLVFYLLAMAGWYFANREVKLKVLFIPYYFLIMNLSVFMGLGRYLSGRQPVNWERSRRSRP